MAEARDLYRTYLRGSTEVEAVRGVSLEIDARDYLAVLGPSGSGKSTLLNLLGGIDRPTAGRVELLGHDTTALSDRRLTRLRLEKVGFVFQRFHLLPALTAAENVELPMAEAAMAKAERRRRVAELLDYVGLSHRLDHRPGELSGGEMQRVAIARALANRPALILADEPTGELDRKTGAEIAELFRRLNADGTTLVVVTHDLGLAEAATRVRQMRDGALLPEEAA
ncbi:MAG: ABC transporter ATP-binding protein [Gemmatimonadetes bacterium]|uniref:ABC transporter ATP-binding protein n=1 Tax=Candidatus Kutchimonas denitrificans TaxID=3056748 RepID=A0AAE5C8G3_9BACT|nr:ABC transporter ATP-binding protein [Gemmatimonadota bacterium]NIR74461.1 ABC transporter ATP-binding protein [Candidatus Kutchimonas denitrificans]NIS00857.1 ABC transporter ATP-binding protein [Gemmatimonadota bacterium]NIT66480.1 ABC transporter ATP-binding protein [Gemmatimonadota bacterium]NIU52111.1 ATP-binding cassette domain-containing protein [Gemmatimonadota bacterium]